jgi:hypothetical protein
LETWESQSHGGKMNLSHLFFQWLLVIRKTLEFIALLFFNVLVHQIYLYSYMQSNVGLDLSFGTPECGL